jgi:hypothetical protein
MAAGTPSVPSYGRPPQGDWSITVSVSVPLAGRDSVIPRLRSAGSKRQVASNGPATAVTVMPAGAVNANSRVSPCTIVKLTSDCISMTPGRRRARLATSA